MRLVACGYTQVEGVDYEETFALVMRYVSFRTILAIAAQQRMKGIQMDFSNAFLNGKLDKPLFMSQPQGFTASGDEPKVCLLQKPIYGLKQSARAWFLELSGSLRDEGYSPTIADSCVWYKISDDRKLSLISI